MKKNSMRRVALGVLVGLVLLVGASWVLILALGNAARSVYAGKSLSDWRVILTSPDAAASNKAAVVVNSRVIPELTEAMFHDTNDSKLRIWLIDTLNQLPGVQIVFTEADGRRVCAADEIGELGPGAKAAIPALLQALKGSDEVVRGPAIAALGEIHSEPDQLIPLLTGYLDDDKLNDEAAKALGNYGVLAKAAVPKILPMLHAPDKDARAAAAEALQKIDPEAYSNAMRMAQAPVTNGPATAR
jgi:HEAT repeat protein